MVKPFISLLSLATLLVGIALPLAAQDATILIDLVPDRAEGDGPHERLILRGGTVIDGTGAPPFGPADIVIENDRITAIRVVGTPRGGPNERRRPEATEGTVEVDIEGMYVLPGFVDMHGHQHTESSGQGVPATYIHKLWMAHGITTSADVGNFNVDWLMHHKERSAKNEITAPRLYAYVIFGNGWGRPITTPELAREWVRWVKSKGADGIKFFGAPPEILRAALDEAKTLGLRTTEHHAQLDVTRMNVLDTARAGLTSMQHWYGLPEAMFEDKRVQDYPVNYNYQDEGDRFREAGRLWKQAAPPHSEKWNAVMNELLELDFTIVPTWVAYLASRDLMKQSRNDWHSVYTLPQLWDFYRPSPTSHGSYWFDWTTQDEIDWKENYRLWMAFVNEYKNRGGRVGVGSDSGYIYNLYGFGYVQEMELFLEAGFHPLEVIRSATLMGAEALGADQDIGSIQVGKLADFVVVPENPLANIKNLFGTGALHYDQETGEMVRIGGVRYTIKNGVVYDARQLLADVREMVRAEREKQGLPAPPMPLFIDSDYAVGMEH
ncbi:MAG: amidohydrolase family protein [Pseudomonadota bacterium]